MSADADLHHVSGGDISLLPHRIEPSFVHNCHKKRSLERPRQQGLLA